jgi:hypothetical protein
MEDYYRCYGPTDPRPAGLPPINDPTCGGELTEYDKEEWAATTADDIVVLDVAPYNTLMTNIAGDYRTSHPHRKAIEALFRKVREKLLPYLQENRERSPIITVLGTVLTVYSVAEGLGMLRGGASAWRATRGGALTGGARFRRVLSGTLRGLRLSRRSAALAVAGGTMAGVTLAVVEHLERRKMDPAVLLAETQDGTVQDIGVQAAAWRAEVRGFTEAMVRNETDRLGRRMDDLELARRDAQLQVDHLSAVAGAQLPDIQPVQMDLNGVESTLRRLMPLAAAMGHTSRVPRAAGAGDDLGPGLLP